MLSQPAKASGGQWVDKDQTRGVGRKGKGERIFIIVTIMIATNSYVVSAMGQGDFQSLTTVNIIILTTSLSSQPRQKQGI